MGQYKIIVKDKARKDLQKHHKSGNRAITRRIEQIFIELEDHPETGIGNPEQLKHEYSGFLVSAAKFRTQVDISDKRGNG